MSFKDVIRQEITKSNQQIFDQLQELKYKLIKNHIAVIQNRSIPYPELIEEAKQKEAERERNIHMYGVSFKDDREQKALEEGRIVF